MLFPINKNPAQASYNIGDVVQLPSSGPAMTVYEVHEESKKVSCAWFPATDHSQVRILTLPIAAVVPVTG
jgi:uncharacterized protein YodC (DUF2158 family)